MAMTHERLAVSSGLHTILTNYRFSGSPNLQNPQPTTSLLEKKTSQFFQKVLGVLKGGIGGSNNSFFLCLLLLLLLAKNAGGFQGLFQMRALIQRANSERRSNLDSRR